MANFEIPSGNHGQKAVEALAQDIAHLAAGLTGKVQKILIFMQY